MILELRNIDAYYGLGHILHGLSLNVAEGEVVALLGRNGAGKTTTLRCVTGLLHPRKGEIRDKGKDIGRLEAHRVSQLGIALVPETRGIFSYLRARENLAIALAAAPRVLLLDEPAAGLSPEETRKMVALVRSLKGRYTIVLIEHKIDIIMSVSDRISVMHFGSLIAEGTPEEIQRNAEVRRAYLGGIAA